MTVIETAPLQGSLFGGGEPSFDGGCEAGRVELDDGAWVEYVPGWLSGDESLAATLQASTTWHAHRRPMYDRMVDVPRLTAALPRDGPVPPVLAAAADCLSGRYDEPMQHLSVAWYRDGRDSVAPHGDQVARSMQTTVMATVSCGAARRFTLSRVAGGSTRSFELGHGDLLVMGGTIQRTWRHGVPKTNRAVGPRLCVMFRPPWLA